MTDFEYMIFPMALFGFWGMALIAVSCLIRCRGKNRRYLAGTAAVFLGALILYFGGLILLGHFNLTWRNFPAMLLCGVILVSGWAGIMFTLACFLPAEMPGTPSILRWVSKGVAVLCAAVVLLVTLWVGPMGIAFVYGGSERVVEYQGPLVDYQGQLLVERMEGFLSPDYSYYPYQGPLVRGTKRILSALEPIN